MQSCQFAKSVSERGSGKFSAARPAALLSAELQYNRSRPCSLWFRNHREMLAMVFSRARLQVQLWWPGHANSVVSRAKPSNSTSTLKGGDRFLSSAHSLYTSCERFWTYVLPNTTGVSCCWNDFVSAREFSLGFGESAFCVSPVFVRTRRYFFTCVTGRPGNYSVASLPYFVQNYIIIQHFTDFSGSIDTFVSLFFLFLCGYCGSPAWVVLELKWNPMGSSLAWFMKWRVSLWARLYEVPVMKRRVSLWTPLLKKAGICVSPIIKWTGICVSPIMIK